MDIITGCVFFISAAWIIWCVGSYLRHVHKSISAFNSMLVHALKQISELQESLHKVKMDVSELKGDKK